MKVENFERDGIFINRNISPDESWRLIHDNVKVIALFYSGGITETRHNLFVADTKEECLEEAQRLSLEIQSDD